MAKGIVTTARGGILNIDELIRMASTPVGKQEVAATRAAPYRPNTDAAPKVRGFVPGQGTGRGPKRPDGVETASGAEPRNAPSSFKDGAPARNLADFTGVKVRKSETATAAKADEIAASTEEDEVLGNLVSQMKTPEPKKK